MGTVCLLYSRPPISWAQNTALTWLSKHLLFANLNTITAAKTKHFLIKPITNNQKNVANAFFSKNSACNFLFKYFCFPLRVEAIFTVDTFSLARTLQSLKGFSVWVVATFYFKHKSQTEKRRVENWRNMNVSCSPERYFVHVFPETVVKKIHGGFENWCKLKRKAWN